MDRVEPISVVNCVIGNNSTQSGGGFWINNSALTLLNSTIAGNDAAEGSALAFNNPDSTSSTVITNCILWNGGGEILNNGGSAVTVIYSDVAGSYYGEGNIDADPNFVDANNGDFGLLAGSGCIDAGTNDPPGGLPLIDRASNPRVLDGNLDGSSMVDMGAYETFGFVGPMIEVSQGEVEFFGVAGGANPLDQKFSVRNAATGVLNWQVSEISDWLTVTPTTGSSTGEFDEILLGVDITGMGFGVYVGEVLVSDPG
ncbi:MAG: DUF5123 domain-containing protein, partial [Planctomycetes bacterium]|nr:DUF5123 domain-containing protein [Planctomycetota bacterium]